MKTTIRFPFITEDETTITIEATIEEEAGDYDTPPILPYASKLETIPASAMLTRSDYKRLEQDALSEYTDMI